MTREQFSADVASYRGMMYRLAFNCLGNRFDADDVTQEAFLRLYRYKKHFIDEEHKKAFLLRVTVNLCKDLKKSAWFRKRAEPDDTITADQDLNENEIIIRESMLKLKQNYRAVIYLFYYEGYTGAEIAKILKISESAVTTRLNRARNQLRTQLIINKETAYHE